MLLLRWPKMSNFILKLQRKWQPLYRCLFLFCDWWPLLSPFDPHIQALPNVFIKVRNSESVKLLPPKCLLNAAFAKGKAPRITRRRRSYFQRVWLSYQELWESASAKTTFLCCDHAQTSRVEILSGVKYVFMTDVLQLMLRTAWSFSVYVHCTSFSIHLGNFIKLKKRYNRYLAFDPLFALVWCRRLSNDTEHSAGWLYSEITKWVKRDFVPNNKGRMGYFFYLMFFVFFY